MNTDNEQTAVQSEQPAESGDITIDLGRIFRALWHYLWVIIVAVILGAAIMYGYTKFFVTELYTTSATVYVSNPTTSGSVSSSDSNVANAMSSIITSRTTIEQAIEENNLPYTYGQIAGTVSVSVGSSGILTISVVYSDPQAAADIANAIISVLSDRATDVFQGTVYVSTVDKATVPSSPSSPNTTKNVLIGALAGAAVSCVVIVLIELLNNKIYSNDYLISTYNIPVLTEIPDFSDRKKGKKYYTTKYGYGNNS